MRNPNGASGVFSVRPNPTRCAMCGSREVTHTESRPTGFRLAPQSWSWCETCWRAYCAEMRNSDPTVTLKWVAFVSVLVLGVKPKSGKGSPKGVGKIVQPGAVQTISLDA